MAKKRKRQSAPFKAKVALAAIKEMKTVSELASQHGIHPNQMHQWKRKLLERAQEVFEKPGGSSRTAEEQDALIADLYEQIGRLKMELEWLKKKATQFD